MAITRSCDDLSGLDDAVLDSSLSVRGVGLTAQGALSLVGSEIVGIFMSVRATLQLGSSLSLFSNACLGGTLSTVCAGSVGRSASQDHVLWGAVCL